VDFFFIQSNYLTGPEGEPGGGAQADSQQDSMGTRGGRMGGKKGEAGGKKEVPDGMAHHTPRCSGRCVGGHMAAGKALGGFCRTRSRA
jgi:hypothetical protein